jgi:hypothetical protein
MRHRFLFVITLMGLTVSGCRTYSQQALQDEIVVEVRASHEATPVSFTVDVLGGPTELRATNGRLYATDAALRSQTPATLTLRPGTTALSFQSLGSDPLSVTVLGPTGRLAASGPYVQFSSTSAGLVIRTK